MTQHFMRSYAQLLVQTCHKRGTHAMGGMAAQIPIKNDPDANHAAMEKVRGDKIREVLGGHDGTWVAHPALVGLAREVFDEHMPQANQIDQPICLNYSIEAKDLLCVQRLKYLGLKYGSGEKIKYIYPMENNSQINT